MDRPKVYLAGGMEYAQDGETWRNTAVYLLESNGVDSWDPYKEETTLFQSPVHPLIKTLDKERDFKQLHEIMHKIVVLDMGVVAKEVSAVLVKYDQAVLRGAGTHAEMSIATYLNKPVHVWLDSDTPLKAVPTWAIGCMTSVSYSLTDAVYNVLVGLGK